STSERSHLVDGYAGPLGCRRPADITRPRGERPESRPGSWWSMLQHRRMHRVSDSSLPPYTDAELVLGLVAPAGTNLDKFTSSVEAVLREFDYKANIVRFSRLASELAPDAKIPSGSPEFQRLSRLMDAGNLARQKGGDVLALAAAGTIAQLRPTDQQ